MPLYQYQCKDCGHVFEEVHGVDNRKIPCESPCPECKKEGFIEIVISAVGTIFGCMASTVQNHKNTPTEFKEHLKRIKNGLNKTGRVKGIE